MNVTECIDAYVRNAPVRTPLYTNEIYDYILSKLPNTSKATFNMTLSRFEKKSNDFIRYKKGIYYKTIHTPFGNAGIDKFEIIKRAYLIDEDEIIGYESGPSYMNKIGLTTQIPKLIYIVTTKARYTAIDKKEGICFIKPVIQVNRNNYRYLQFLDILANRMNVNIEASNYLNILRKQIDTFKLSFEKLVGYAKYYKNITVYKTLSELAKGID